MTDTTDPLAAAIEATIWKGYTDAEPSEAGLVLANPRNIAAVAASVARAHTPVPSAPADRAALRDRIAAALYERERPPRDPAWADAYAMDREVFEPMADAVLAVLPEPADRAAVLREAANGLAALGPLDSLVSAPAAWNEAIETVRRMADQIAEAKLRRMPVEAQQPETQADDAHPAEHTWAAELHDPLADEWVPGTRYLARDRAVNALAHAKRLGPVWKDGTPVERRLVRAATTYTVETPPAVEARQADTAGEQQ